MVDIEGLQIGPDNPVRIMGVINLSPESFYKGAIAETVEEFQIQFSKAISEGADIIDIGGASTAPTNIYGTSKVSIDEEIKRISAALQSLSDMQTPISIDTTSSRVAEIALDLGASIVNDVSGLQADPKMAKLVAERQVAVILMANCDPPCGSVQKSLDSLRTSLRLAEDNEIDSRKIILDPGIGFGKPPDVDISILENLNRFVILGHPLLVGVSRKAFIGHLLDQDDSEDRLVGSIAATSIAVMNGADMIRTHDVKEAGIAVRIGEAIREKQGLSGS
ncbi:MAG: dihydropteroate synthase [Candidatus Thorarchaeota archaeon]